ncbi:hypothetical protein PSTG_12971 [Puccinia striiformis f. sp. tritici PST-78]|uniref:Uncharacterized protein n=2 Tax=Puccinia striiformis f. sp. tritici PST-78 TaxID=1165861 RepID=A0A0L0V304_9BASI|nr:hypothetical protein PSTG_12971 [Puccinia striiformis f. sp. tritici PST-78]
MGVEHHQNSKNSATKLSWYGSPRNPVDQPQDDLTYSRSETLSRTQTACTIGATHNQTPHADYFGSINDNDHNNNYNQLYGTSPTGHQRCTPLASDPSRTPGTTTTPKPSTTLRITGLPSAFIPIRTPRPTTTMPIPLSTPLRLASWTQHTSNLANHGTPSMGGEGPQNHDDGALASSAQHADPASLVATPASLRTNTPRPLESSPTLAPPPKAHKTKLTPEQRTANEELANAKRAEKLEAQRLKTVAQQLKRTDKAASVKLKTAAACVVSPGGVS